MSKPKYIEFDDGRQAIIYNLAMINRNRLSSDQQFWMRYTSGLFKIMVIKETKELMLLRKDTI